MDNVPNGQTADVQMLVRELDRRLKDDFKWMRRCRHLHRAIGILFTIVLVAAPPIVAAGILPSDSIWGKLLLLAATVVAALNSVFQPLALSDFRRQDMGQIGLLRDQYRAALANTVDEEKRIALFKHYTRKSADLFVGRSARLLDTLLSNKGPVVAQPADTRGATGT